MKQRLVLSIALATIAVGMSACGEQKRDPTQWPMTRDELVRNAPSDNPAELTYRRYCIGCHGSDGRGNGGVTGADLTAADGPLAQHSDEELATSVREGKRGKSATMPPHKPVLKDEQIAAVVSYVRESFQPKTAAQQ